MDDSGGYVVLGDVAKRITKGTTPTTAGGSFSNDGIAFVKVESITSDGRIDRSKVAHIDATTDGLLARSRLEKDDILFTIAGTIGRTALVDDDILPANTNQAVAIIRPNRRLVEPRFLYYALRDSERIREAHTRVVQSVQSNFSLAELARVELPCPSLLEQRRVARALGLLDDKIELNRRMSATAEAMSSALFKSWFVDFDPVRAKAEGRDPGLTPEIAALFPDSFEPAEPGGIPKGWRIGPLGEVAVNKRLGISHRDIPENTPYIGLEHMPRRNIALERWGYAESLESNKSKFQRGDILFGKLRPYFHKVGVAPVSGVCSTDILVATATSSEWFGFVLMHLCSDALVAHTDRCSTGTKMPRASWEHISRYEVALPPNALAELFTALISPMVDRIVAAIFESRTLSTIRDALLPKVMSGEIRVGEAERIVEKTA